MVLDTSLLNTQQYKYVSRVKWSNPVKGVVTSFIPQCSSYGKGSLLVTLDYSRQLYLFVERLMEHFTKLFYNLSVMDDYAINNLP